MIWFRLIALRIYPTIDWWRNIWYIYYFKVNPLLVKFNPLQRLYNIIYLRFFTNKNWCYIHFIERTLKKINSIFLVLICILVYFVWWVFRITKMKMIKMCSTDLKFWIFHVIINVADCSSSYQEMLRSIMLIFALPFLDDMTI